MTQDVQKLKEQARKLISEHLEVDIDKIGDDAHFSDDLGADSLDMVELVMAFEEEFDVAIEDEKAEQATTLNKIVGLLTEAA